MKRPESRISAKAAFSSPRSGAYCALTSTWGIGGTAGECSRPAFSEQEKRCKEDDSADDRVVGEAEVLVEALPVAADAPTDAGERERPCGRADERQGHVRREPHPEDARRDRDERPRDRSHAADEDGELVPAVEPALRARELLGREVQPAAVPLEVGPAAVDPDRPADDRADEIAERTGDGHREVRPERGCDPVAEEGHV